MTGDEGRLEGTAGVALRRDGAAGEIERLLEVAMDEGQLEQRPQGRHLLPAATERGAQAALRRRMNMIFQDPYASLNPRWRVRDIVAEPIRAFGLLGSRKDIVDRVAQLLQQVGLASADGEKYPHEFSGGQRQRISIARAVERAGFPGLRRAD